MRPTSRLLFAALCAVLLASTGSHRARAEDFSAGFDEARTSWKTQVDSTSVRILQHRRHAQKVVQGKASEYILAERAPGSAASLLTLEHSIPAARIIDDLKVTLWVNSNRTGVIPFLRVVFPHARDPATGETLTTLIPSGGSTEPGQWQQLECSITEKQLQSRIVLLRGRIQDRGIDLREAYVDRVVLQMELAPGASELFVDELRVTGIIPPGEVSQVAADAPQAPQSPVEFRLDRLLVDGKPFFPRMVALHQEPLSSLKDAGMNLIWVPDHDNLETLTQIREHGLWAAATPPRATDEEGKTLDPLEANMLPFGDRTLPVLIWNMGTRIPASAKEDVFRWIDQVKNADHRFRRPLMIDVSGNERMYSRKAPMIGVSRHVVQTSLSFKQYRDWMAQRRKLALPGSFLWTWIQTEPASAQAEWRQAAGIHPAVVEPEQIRLQVYAALAGGCRGLGFWKTTQLDGDGPGALERRLILSQLNLEIELLEPWLSTGAVSGTIPFEVKASRLPSLGQRVIGFMNSEPEKAERDAMLRARDDDLKQNELLKQELEATLIRGEYGMLVLPIWYGTDAQFVPGQLAANDATIIIPGADESASIWEVTTTGVRSLAAERVAGGTKIKLAKFDQTAALIVTSDQKYARKLREQADRMAARSAEITLALAKAKFERVKIVDEELRSQGLQQPDGHQLIARATQLVTEAETAQSRQDFAGTRLRAEEVMQLMRILQKSHWNDAVRTLSSPVASPHTVCFQTLPDHYRMLAELGRSSANDVNLLRSGDFEDPTTMKIEGWRHTQGTIEGITASASLYPVSQQGKYSLNLKAVPSTAKNAETPAVIADAPVVVTTPPVTVHAGQIVHISGLVKVVTPVTGSLDGVMLYDSLLGTSSAVRWRQPTANWTRFELIREVQESGPLTLTLALTGLGEVFFDDLKIVPHAPSAEVEPTPSLAAGAPAGARNSAANSFLRNLPRIPRLSSRRPSYTPEDPPSAPSPTRLSSALESPPR